MAVLNLMSPEKAVLTDSAQIRAYLDKQGVFFDQWPVSESIAEGATQEDILKSFEPQLKPFMSKGGYTVSDVINVTENTPNLPALRAKFLSEHIHTEDEIRFFVRGEGLFWFNFSSGEVAALLCQKGDLISVPKNMKHWFTLGEKPNVTAIRIFIDPAGWVPHYTESQVEKAYTFSF